MQAQFFKQSDAAKVLAIKAASLLVKNEKEKRMAFYLHEVPGRLRIQIPALKRNPLRAEEVQDLLEDLSGIKSTSVNTVTGSVIVHYDPEIVNSGAILTILSREEYIDVAKAISTENNAEKALAKAGHVVTKALLGIALDRALQGSPLSILTAFI
jgi:hypothetical protein